MAALSCSVGGCAAARGQVVPAPLGDLPSAAEAAPLSAPSTVDEVEVVGADPVPETAAARAFDLGFSAPLDPAKLERGRVAAEQVYADFGYPDTHIRVELVPVGGARVRVVARVSLGAPARIADVTFVGATAAPADLGRASGLVPGAICSRALLEDAPRRLRFFLAERGHVDASATVDPVTTGTREPRLVVRVSEGPAHSVGRIRFQGVDAPPPGALRLREGAPFRPTDARADADVLGALAPPGTNIAHHVAIDRRARRVDVTFARGLPDIY